MKMKDIELEWKSELVHNVWLAGAQKRGLHHPDTHLRNPMIVPPRLRDDGKTRCDQCNLNMVPYQQLSESVKQADRDIVLNMSKVSDAWEESRDGRIPPVFPQEVWPNMSNRPAQVVAKR